MESFTINKISASKKSIHLTIFKEEGFLFINRKKEYFLLNIYSKDPIPIEEDLEKIVQQIKKTPFQKDIRLKNGYTHKLDLSDFPALNIRIKKIEEPKTEEPKTENENDNKTN